ncbi:type II toxin-antitoxin system RelB/DinJ family antitoxin [Lactobacillus sp. CC-MHH1034]|uniref:type II toxin-antitoxin system RelB/DinJ family antitoxin n=1 Tax=Agrilactobacillus fermenti TaxID=2586909 RepID=UPI001E420265|nr:type II toxin-antitoxin system RelB/DinJ family antitoxin [Agrilactobacillus fermenti]MCD2257466.1 type II toxin-antitoxin system RelB/DinJ family antitoxin [Agrilactobacillus fermenti]
MSNTPTSDRINTRIDPKIKQKAQEQLAQHGLTMSEFVRVVITTVANNGLPKYYGFPNQQVVNSLTEVADDIAGTTKLKSANSQSELEQLLDE